VLLGNESDTYEKRTTLINCM